MEEIVGDKSSVPGMVDHRDNRPLDYGHRHHLIFFSTLPGELLILLAIYEVPTF
jgi:hypothetical protein